MSHPYHNSRFLIALFLFIASSSLFAQQTADVKMSGTKMRAPLSVPKGVSTLHLCGLEAGNTYKLAAVPMDYAQKAGFDIAPDASWRHHSVRQDKKHILQFTAPSECVEIRLHAESPEQGTEIPMYLSVKCESCPDTRDWLNRVSGLGEQAVIEVQDGFSAQELIENVLVGGGCFQISNVSYEGHPAQIGTFSNGSNNIGFSEGVIMATGNIEVAPGPNDADGLSSGFGFSTPDADLETLTTGDINDMANIEFDFVPTENQVAFEFVFASEEYCEYVLSPFNDVFGFFISGPGIVGTKNIALIPNTNTPITINNVNHVFNNTIYTHNTPISGDNCFDGGYSGNLPPAVPAFGPAVFEVQYDGFTKKLVAVANVIPCQTYHIKLKIGDVGDGVWDSAVFLRANSFSAGGEVLASPAYPGGFGTAYESCDAGNIRFVRGNNTDLSQPLVIHFNVAGTATPGMDYVPLNSPVIIPAGETELLVPVQLIPDALIEGQENILIQVPNSCSCSESTIEFLINDRPAMTIESNDQFLCAGETATISPLVSGGLPGYTYLWNTGETTASISTSTTGTYTLNVSDACGGSVSVSTEIVFEACGCSAETFLKTLEFDDANVRGYGVYDSQDGNLYITGAKQDSAALIKMTPSGTILWMRTFDVQDGANDHISEIILDSEGMIVGCGQSGDLQPGISGFFFRYDPVANNLLWINTYGLESPYVMGLMELPNGNYLVYDNPHSPENDNRMLEITRADGFIDPGSPLTQQFHLGGADNFNSALIFNDKLYGVGRYTNGQNFTDMRHALSQIDLASGTMEWSQMGHVSQVSLARIYGMDLLIEDDHIYSVSFGDEDGEDLNDSRIFLQKTDLNGNLQWVKRFDVLGVTNESVDEIISVPDGFILYGRALNAPSDLYLIKTDKNGVLLWSKKVDYGFNDNVGPVSIFQSQILRKDNHLFFIASTENPAENSRMLVAKTTLDAVLEGNCDFIQPTPVLVEDVVDAVYFPVNQEERPVSDQASTIVRMPRATSLVVTDRCEVFVNDTVLVELCLGESVTIDSVTYNQDTIVMAEIPGTGGCDTLRTYIIDLLPQPMQAFTLDLCPGKTVLIGGQPIDQPGTYILSVEGQNGDCDTIVTYTVVAQPYQTREESVELCPGESINIGGQVYDQPGVVVDTVAANIGCDTIITYTLSLLPYQTAAENVTFCPGETVTIGGQVYNQPGTVLDTISSATGGCDVIVTYTLTQLPYQTASENISFCPGETVTIGGQVYDQSGTVIDTIPSATGGCDVIVTYTLTLLNNPVRSESISFCPGESVTIGGQVYDQSGTVLDTIPSATGGCDTIVTYTLTLLAQPTLEANIAFCPGETISLGGNNYTQPGTVVLTLPSATGGCDTIATYTLEFLTPAPSNVSISCPAAITIGQPGGSSGAMVTYSDPTANSDCPCPGIELTMTSGLPSGSMFPMGVTPVCFAAKDSCGQTATCCFNVTIEEDDPCDTKVAGCVKYELLTITEDMGKNRTYRIRVTNNCSNKLLYTAIQVPDGVVAMEPDNNSIYTAPSGNTYRVRNPNFSPQYSVRYSSISDSINNGESDIFKYTLPAQSDVLFIHVVSRLQPYVYLAAHLNTFYCPIGITPSDDRPGGEREAPVLTMGNEPLFLFPNPTSGELFADLSPWKGERLQLQVLDSRGQRVHHAALEAMEGAQAIDLPVDWPDGLYYVEMVTERGVRQTARFVKAN